MDINSGWENCKMIKQRLQKVAAARLRTVLRLEAQDSNWTLTEWERYSNAWAYGLRELGVEKGARVLSWLDENHTGELASVLIGNAKAGVETLSAERLLAEGKRSIEQVVAETSPDVFIFSPHQLSAGRKKEEHLDAILRKFKPRLLVHTGLYSKPYGPRFKDVMYYRDSRFSSVPELDYDSNLSKLLEAPFLKADQKDAVFYTGSFNDYPRLLRALLEAAAEKAPFLNFAPLPHLVKQGKNVADLLDENTKAHFLSTNEQKGQIEQTLSRKNNTFNFI